MFVNGKDVNYLMLNGEVFGSEKRFPAEYDFGRGYDYVKIYGCSITENGVKFSPLLPSNIPNTYSPTTAEINQISIVSCKVTYQKEIYILVLCSKREGIPDWVKEDNVWVKLKDVGGVLKPAK